MLIEQTLEKLTAMQLHGMVSALRQWQAHPPAQPLTPADLIGLLADAEWVSRENRKLTARLKAAKVQVLVLDDFGLEPLGAAERKVLLEVLEDRYGLAATIITSQLDPKDWHPVIGDETVADAICDRLVHGAHRIKLTGESLRKGLTNGTKPAK